MNPKKPTRYLQISIAAFLAIAVITLAGGLMKPAPEPVVEIPVPDDPRRAWADSVARTMNLDQKVGQLFIGVMNADGLPKSFEDALFQVRKFHAGGFKMVGDRPEVISKWSGRLQAICRFPLWTIMDTREMLRTHSLYPSPDLLGTVVYDSIVETMGYEFSRQYRKLGANVALHEPMVNHKKQEAEFLSGIQSGGVPVIAITPPVTADTGVTGDTPDRGDTGVSKNYGKPAQSNLRVFTEDSVLRANLAGIDSMEFYKRVAVRAKDSIWQLEISAQDSSLDLDFRDGLQFATLESAKGKELDTRTQTLTLVKEGVDQIFAGRSLGMAARAIKEAVQTGELSPEWLEWKVRKILYAKLMAGLDCAHIPDPQFAANTEKDMTSLANCRLFMENSIVMVRNSDTLLPVGPTGDIRIASLVISNRQTSDFQKTLNRYVQMEHFRMKLHPEAGVTDAILAQLYPYNLVIVNLDFHGKTMGTTVSNFLTTLNNQNRVIICNTGYPERLEELTDFTAIIQAWRDKPQTREMLAQMVMGGVLPNGRLHKDISENFCSGEGIAAVEPVRVKYSFPEEVGIESYKLERIDSIANAAIFLGVFPGCQVMVIKDGKAIYQKSFGHHTYDRKRPVRNSDIYDIASVTKACATTFATMLAYEEDSIELTGTLGQYLPQCDSTNVAGCVVAEMLTHNAGLPEAIPMYYYMTVADSADSIRNKYYSPIEDSAFCYHVAQNMYLRRDHRDSLWEKIGKVKRYNYGRYAYTDLGFLLLGEMCGAVYQSTLDSVLYNKLYGRLGLRNIGYLPLNRYDPDRIVPTSDEKFFRYQRLKGTVHDPAAAIWGGVAGHAGLFSNAHDLGVLMQVLMRKGTYGREKFFSPETVDMFIHRYPGCHRGLGFDKRPNDTTYTNYCGESASQECYGHIGFTGTCVWNDPDNDLTYVFLSNRVHPKSRNFLINAFHVRQGIHQVIYDALGIEAPATELHEHPTTVPDTVDIPPPVDTVKTDSNLAL